MKKLIIIAAILIFGFSANAEANKNYSKRVGGYFYTALSPYGSWIEINTGTIVWRPKMIRRNWSPYSRGRWLWTDYGWYWDSYEAFGQIVFHYGRWYYDDYYGWIWFPDDEWAPAWVDWRYDDDYIGWAPLSPYALFSISVGIYFTNDYHVPYSHWNYVKYNNFSSPVVYNYYVGSKYKYRIHSRTKYRRNYVYDGGRVRNYGVDYDRIRERGGREITRRDLVTVNDPREISRNRDSKNSDREIRTYIAKREDLSRDELRNVKITRSDRKTSLDLSKVELGRNRNLERNKNNDTRKDDNSEVIRKDRVNTTLDKRDRTKDTRKEVQKNVTRDRNDNERKILERNDFQKRNSEVEKRNNEQIKRNGQNSRNEQIEFQRKSNEETKKRNNVTVQKREEKKNNTDVFKQNNERKNGQVQQTQRSEQRTKSTARINRNTEVKRNDSNNRTENKNNDRTSEQKNKTRNRR